MFRYSCCFITQDASWNEEGKGGHLLFLLSIPAWNGPDSWSRKNTECRAICTASFEEHSAWALGKLFVLRYPCHWILFNCVLEVSVGLLVNSYHMNTTPGGKVAWLRERWSHFRTTHLKTITCVSTMSLPSLVKWNHKMPPFWSLLTRIQALYVYENITAAWKGREIQNSDFLQKWSGSYCSCWFTLS